MLPGRQAAYLVEKGEGEVDIALLARRADAPREVELNYLRVCNCAGYVKRQADRVACDPLQLYKKDQRMVLYPCCARDSNSSVDLHQRVSGTSCAARQRCTCPQRRCLLVTRAAVRQRARDGGRVEPSRLRGGAGSAWWCRRHRRARRGSLARSERGGSLWRWESRRERQGRVETVEATLIACER